MRLIAIILAGLTVAMAYRLATVDTCPHVCQWNTYTDATGSVTWPECDPVDPRFRR